MGKGIDKLSIALGTGILFISLASGISDEINKIKYGKEEYNSYLKAKQTISNQFMFQRDSLQNAYEMQHKFDRNYPKLDSLKKDFQEKEKILTEKHYEDLKNLKDALTE